jgi:hypothetical protein
MGVPCARAALHTWQDKDCLAIALLTAAASGNGELTAIFSALVRLQEGQSNRMTAENQYWLLMESELYSACTSALPTQQPLDCFAEGIAVLAVWV